MSTPLTIVVVEEDRDRAIAIVDALKDSGDYEVFVIGNASGLARKIAAHAPDVVLIDIDNPTRDMLEELTLASGPLERPVAMFVSGSAGSLARQAVEAGVSAYVVDGLAPERLKPVMDTAIARFQMVRQMRSELAETRRALEERKVDIGLIFSGLLRFLTIDIVVLALLVLIPALSLLIPTSM